MPLSLLLTTLGALLTSGVAPAMPTEPATDPLCVLELVSRRTRPDSQLSNLLSSKRKYSPLFSSDLSRLRLTGQLVEIRTTEHLLYTRRGIITDFTPSVVHVRDSFGRDEHVPAEYAPEMLVLTPEFLHLEREYDLSHLAAYDADKFHSLVWARRNAKRVDVQFHWSGPKDRAGKVVSGVLTSFKHTRDGWWGGTLKPDEGPEIEFHPLASSSLSHTDCAKVPEWEAAKKFLDDIKYRDWGYDDQRSKILRFLELAKGAREWLRVSETAPRGRAVQGEVVAIEPAGSGVEFVIFGRRKKTRFAVTPTLSIRALPRPGDEPFWDTDWTLPGYWNARGADPAH